MLKSQSEEGATHCKPVRGWHRSGWWGRPPATLSSTQSPRGRWWSRAPTRCCSRPRGHRARLSWQAELSEGVWSGRREAGHLPFWTGVAPRGPGSSLIHGLLGGGLLCAGLTCEGLSTWGLLAGFTGQGQLLGMWVLPVQVLRVSRHHLTDRTLDTHPLCSWRLNSLSFQRAPDLPLEEDPWPKDLLGAGSQLPALLRPRPQASADQPRKTEPGPSSGLVPFEPGH